MTVYGATLLRSNRMPTQSQNYALAHKRNDTLSFVGRAKLPSGSWTASAKLKLPESDVLVADLDVSSLTPLVSDPQGYTHGYVVSHAETGQGTWPIQLVDCDVQYVRGSDNFTKSTPTFQVKIYRDQA